MKQCGQEYLCDREWRWESHPQGYQGSVFTGSGAPRGRNFPTSENRSSKQRGGWAEASMLSGTPSFSHPHPHPHVYSRAGEGAAKPHSTGSWTFWMGKLSDFNKQGTLSSLMPVFNF